MGKPNIICVDDERIVLRSLKEQLKPRFGTDYNIEIAESSQEALGLFEEFCEKKEEVPLIIADYIMPGMKGDELLKCIRRANPKTVAVLLTGQATLQGITNAVNYGGIYKCITKPWDGEKLYSVVSEALNCYYRDRLGEEKNTELKNINRKLEQTIHKKAEELEKRRKLMESAGRIAGIGQMVEDISDEVTSSLSLIKNGMDAIHAYRKKINEGNPESMAVYMKSVDDFYRVTASVIENLSEAFERKNLKSMIQSAENSHSGEMPGKVISIRNRITESVDGLSGKVREIERQFSRNVERVIGWEEEEMLIFSLDEVLYFTSEEGNTFVETKEGRYKSKDTLDVLEVRLGGQYFFRCHRGFLINVNHISKIIPWGSQSYFIKLKGSSCDIPVSRNRIREMKNILGI